MNVKKTLSLSLLVALSAVVLPGCWRKKTVARVTTTEEPTVRYVDNRGYDVTVDGRAVRNQFNDEVVDPINDKAASVKETVKRKAHNAKESIKEGYNNAKESIKENYNKAKDSIQENIVDPVKTKVHNLTK